MGLVAAIHNDVVLGCALITMAALCILLGFLVGRALGTVEEAHDEAEDAEDTALVRAAREEAQR